MTYSVITGYLLTSCSHTF